MEVATLTPEQIELRMTGLGASEVAAVAGLHPYQGAIDIYAQKRRLVPPFEGNKATLWGQRIEGVVADAYAQEQGVTLRKVGTLRHAENEWMLATPDRLVFPDVKSEAPVRGLEIKNASLRLADEWGEGEDEVPEHHLIQCQWSMAVTGLKEWDLAVLIGGNDDRMYRLRADPELQAELIEVAGRFWFENVLPGVQPEVDGTEPWSKYLAARFPRDERPLLPATEEARSLLEEFRARREVRRAAEQVEEETKNRIKALIGDAAGIQGIATWKATRPTQRTDWEAVCRELPSVPAELIMKHTTTKPGARRFLPCLPKE